MTGEERIVPPDARWFLCTAESMPTAIGTSSFLALDEAQLGADPERGHVFTDRLLRARGPRGDDDPRLRDAAPDDQGAGARGGDRQPAALLDA